MSQPVGIVQIPLAPQGQVMNPSFGQLANLVNGPLGLVSWANSLTNWLSQVIPNIQTSLNTQVQGAGPTLIAQTQIATSNFEHKISGTGTIETINPPPGFNGFLCLKALNGFSLGTGGNIFTAASVPQDQMACLLWDAVDAMWFVLAVTAPKITAGTGISVTQNGNAASISNTGVTSIHAGNGIAVSSASGKTMVTSMAVSSVAMKGDGTIYSNAVHGSPITSSGTLAPSLVAQQMNTVLAGPTSGTATPTFRAIVGSDLPNPTSTTLGGIESFAAVAHEWINQISTSGVPSATQPATTDLSDFATRTWTPADNSGASLTFTAVTAKYTKFGNIVLAYAALTYPSTANGSNASISGLPFTSANQTYTNPFMVSSVIAALGVYGTVTSNSKVITFQNVTGGAAVTNAQLTTAAITFIAIYSTT